MCVGHEPPAPYSHPLEDSLLAGSAAILCTGGLNMIRKEAWSFYRTIFGFSLCWELKEPLSCRESIYAFGSRLALQCRGSCRGDKVCFCWGVWVDPKGPRSHTHQTQVSRSEAHGIPAFRSFRFFELPTQADTGTCSEERPCFFSEHFSPSCTEDRGRTF